jgi:hypothetical protein
MVTVCGDICLYGKVEDYGAFKVPVRLHLNLEEYTVQLHGGPARVSLYTSAPPLVDNRSVFSSPLILPLLPITGPTIILDDSAQTLISGDVTLTLAAGTRVTPSLESLGQDPKIANQFRALTVIDPAKVPFPDIATPPAALYGFAPFEVAFSQKAQLTFVNTPKLPAGAAVDVYAMRGLETTGPPAGPFEQVASAHVSSNGLEINMNPNEGVLALTWIALRPH